MEGGIIETETERETAIERDTERDTEREGGERQKLR